MPQHRDDDSGISDAQGYSMARYSASRLWVRTVVLRVLIGLAMVAGVAGVTTMPAQAEQDQAAASPLPQLGLVCPAPAICYGWNYRGSPTSVSISIVATDDGGATWHRQVRLKDKRGAVMGLACPLVRTCYLVDFRYILQNGFSYAGVIAATARTTDGARTWQVETRLPGLALHLPTCPSAQICFVVGQTELLVGPSPCKCQVLATDDGGRHWVRVHAFADPPGQNGIPIGLSCPTTQVCFVGVASASEGRGTLLRILKTSDGGRHWSRVYNHRSHSAFSSLTCAGDDTCCVAGFDTVLRATDGGQTWSEPE